MSKFKLANEENIFIHSKFETQRKKLLKNNEDQKSGSVKRILAAISKFPLPILSGKQVLYLLQGIGPFWAAKIDKWLLEKPSKRRAPPEPLPKRSIFIPEFGTPEWIVLMCLHYSSSPAAVYDFPYLVFSHLSAYSFPPLPDLSTAFSCLLKHSLIVEDSGQYCLTDQAKTLTQKLQSECPTAAKLPCQKFSADSWLAVNPSNLDSQTECESSESLDFEIVLFVDTAERLEMDFDLILQRLSKRKLAVERKKLWVGDYQWVCRIKDRGKTKDFALNYVVERKTADDLAHSIIDFRYEEQKIRMKISGATCIYLLEGKNPKQNSKISASTLINSLISTKFNYGFQVKITRDEKDTLNWLARFTCAIFEEVRHWKWFEVMNLPSFEEFYDETNPRAGVSVKDVWGKQLRALDRVGEQNTLAILGKVATPYLFYTAANEASKMGKRGLNKFFKEFKLENGNSLNKNTKDVLVKLFLEG